MSAGDALRSVLIASEPLTIDTTSWLELPEYSMITASAGSDGLEFQTLDLDA
jgi:glutamine amidotransferase